jgi:GPH family glycoside/pentoside/hexuronide:cation symporter
VSREPDHLSRRTKLIYGAGDTGFSLTTTIIGAYYLIFLTDVVGVAPGVAAISIFVGKSWDYINDPIFGYLSDRTRTRWGRRRPFLLFGALPFALTFTMLWWRPPWDNVALLALYYAVAYIFFDAAATLVYMPYFALTPELTSDYDERTSLTSYRMFFSIFGSLLAFTIPLLIIGSFQPDNANRVLLMGLVFGIISALPLLLVFLGTRERSEFMEQEKPALRQSLQSAIRNKPFVVGLLLFLVTWIAIDVLQSTLLFFIKYVVQREAQSDLIMASIFVTAILALPVWNWAAQRWSKRWAYVAGIAFWVGVQMLLITLNPATSLTVILFMCILAGLGVSAAHVLTWAMIPDAVEWGEWQTGERNEGMLYSLTTLVRKVTASLAVPAVGLILQVTGYVPNAAQQPERALLGIRIAFGPLPAALLCLGILFALLYPLGREEYARIIHELAERRTAATEEVV